MKNYRLIANLLLLSFVTFLDIKNADASNPPLRLRSLNSLKLSPNYSWGPLESNVSTINSSPRSALSQVLEELESEKLFLSRGYHDEIYFLIAVVEEKRGRKNSAIKAYQQSLTRRANNPSALARLGLIAKQSKDYDKSINLLNEARWLLKSPNPELLIALSGCFSAKNLPLKAEKLLQEAGVINPNHSSIVKPMLDLRLSKLEKTGDKSEKLALEKEIFQYLGQLIDSGNRDKKYVNMYADYNLKLSDPLVDSVRFDTVERLLSDLNQSSKGDVSTFESHVLTLLKRRKLNEAGKIVDSAKEKFPSSPTIIDLENQLKIELGGFG